MTSNALGRVLKLTTFGESHGPGIGAVIDGCPAGITVDLEQIQADLDNRAPGNSPFTSPRKEPDRVEILSGVFQKKTTGAPIALWIANRDHKPEQYEAIKDCFRPGHAHYSYLQKYGIYDHRGGGRASARETAARVAAASVISGALAEKGITVCSYLQQVGDVHTDHPLQCDWPAVLDDAIFCPHSQSLAMQEQIAKCQAQSNSIGGVVGFHITGLPSGLGDPIYQKFDVVLAQAMMSLPASKGFELGEGFAAASMTGAEHNDTMQSGDTAFQSNHAGGLLGGISTGMPVYGRVAFKPTSSIKKSQETLTTEGQETTLTLPAEARHDPCVAIRAVPVVRAMAQWVVMDLYLTNRLSQW